MHNATANPAAVPARMLLAEDDPTSCYFLAEALRGLGYTVDACADGAAAMALAEHHRFDLLILDRRMPRAGAEDIMQALSSRPDWRSHGQPAIATSAEITPRLEARLRRLGFVDVWRKPVSLDVLEQRLGRIVQHPADTATAPGLLDDAAALVTCGNADTMDALRQLFAGELESLQREWPSLPDPRAIGERLHRLKASCGFCGAAMLATHAQRLKRCVDAGQSLDQAAVSQFMDTVRATRHALQQPAAPLPEPGHSTA